LENPGNLMPNPEIIRGGYNAPKWWETYFHDKGFKTSDLPDITPDEFDDEFIYVQDGLDAALEKARHAATCPPYGRLHKGIFDRDWHCYEPMDRSIYLPVFEHLFISKRTIRYIQTFLRKHKLWRVQLGADYCGLPNDLSPESAVLVYPNEVMYFDARRHRLASLEEWHKRCEQIFQTNHRRAVDQLDYLKQKLAQLKWRPLPPFCVLATTRIGRSMNHYVWTLQKRTPPADQIRFQTPVADRCEIYGVHKDGTLTKYPKQYEKGIPRILVSRVIEIRRSVKTPVEFKIVNDTTGQSYTGSIDPKKDVESFK
jgi:hypothetical protein